MADDIGKAVKDARAAALLAFVCLTLLAVMLLIDGRRNRFMVEKVSEARSILEDFQQAVFYAAGQAQAGTVGGDPDSPCDNCDDSGSEPGADLESAPAAGTGQPANGVVANETVVVSADSRAGGAGGPRGDG